jgi:hypothetical protein
MEHLKTVIEKLGIDSETLTKLEKGEIQADEVVNGLVSTFEKTVADRIGKVVEEQKKSELFGAAYAKTEKQFADEFGMDLSKYETVDKKDRFKTIVKDLKFQQTELLDKLKSEYSGVNAQKLQQLTEQLELANAKLKDKEQSIADAIRAEQEKLINYKRDNQIEKVRNVLIEGVKNARLTQKEMRAVFDAEIREKKYDFELDDSGNVWITKDGQRVKHPQRPTDNLKYETLFEMIASENNFIKQSNGGEKKTFEIDDKVAGAMHPNRVKYVTEKY